MLTTCHKKLTEKLAFFCNTVYNFWVYETVAPTLQSERKVRTLSLC